MTDMISFTSGSFNDVKNMEPSELDNVMCPVELVFSAGVVVHVVLFLKESEISLMIV